MLRFELVDTRSGPAPVSDKTAGEPTLPGVNDETKLTTLPVVMTFPKGLTPPRFTVVLERLIRGLAVVLVRVERPMLTSEKRDETEPPVAERRGPESVTVAGATSSVEGTPVKVSRTSISVPPEREFGPASIVEFVSWIKGAVVVLES